MSGYTASRFPPKLRAQLLLQGMALKQSSGGQGERQGGGGGQGWGGGGGDWSHSDIETVPPLHSYLVRPRHSGGFI